MPTAPKKSKLHLVSHIKDSRSISIILVMVHIFPWIFRIISLILLLPSTLAPVLKNLAKKCKFSPSQTHYHSLWFDLISDRQIPALFWVRCSLWCCRPCYITSQQVWPDLDKTEWGHMCWVSSNIGTNTAVYTKYWFIWFDQLFHCSILEKLFIKCKSIEMYQ